jgi:putative molybdopterin biosynthesis protein
MNTMELLSPQDLRRILKVSRATAYKIIRSGRLKVYRVGRLVRIAPADLGRYLQGGAEETDTSAPRRRK